MGFVSISLLVIRGATLVLVRERWARRRRVLEREPVLLVGENVLDRAQAIGAESRRPITRRFEPIGPVDAAEAHQPEARAVALFGMRTALQNAGGEAARRRAGLFRPGDQARRRPFGVRPMRARPVGELRGKPASAGEARMHGDAVPLEEDFDGQLGQPGLDARVDQLIRHAVEVVVDLDVVIDVHATRLPGRQLVARARQRLSAGRSICSKSVRRLTPRPFIGRRLIASTQMPIAALRSASVKKV